MLRAQSVQVDESLITGEVDPVHKDPGGTLLSGSFVVAGSLTMRATAVGDDAYAQHLAAEARRFALTKSALQQGINRILRVVTWLLIPIGGLLLWSQLQTDHSLGDSMVATVAGVVGMVPQGLVLLVSMASAVAVIRLGRRTGACPRTPRRRDTGACERRVRGQAGTLTTGHIRNREPQDADRDPAEPAGAIAAIAAADPHPNPTMQGVAEAYPDNPGSGS